MTERDEILTALEAALACGETSVIVRSAGAIAEVHGLVTVRQGGEWVTLGEEGRTHVHLKIVEGCRLRYRHSDDQNKALELSGPEGEILCRVTFRGTNRRKTDTYHPERASTLDERFVGLSESGET